MIVKLSLILSIVLFVHPSIVVAGDSLLQSSHDLDVNQYRMSSEQNDAVFRLNLANFFAKARSSDSPHLIVIAGQPGAGKSWFIAHVLANDIIAGGYTLLDVDSFRDYHPKARYLMWSNPISASLFTNPDVFKWAAKLDDMAIDDRLNMVIHLCQMQGAFAERMKKFRSAGYKISLKFLAVRSDVSEQNIVERYEEGRLKDAGVRTVPRQYHEEMVTCSPFDLALVEERKLVDELTVHGSNGELLYENRLIDAEWASPPSSAVAVLTERNRPMSVSEEYAQCARLSRIQALMTRSGSASNRPRFRQIIEARDKACEAVRPVGWQTSPFSPVRQTR